ncbi:MAG TPA: VOC family protein, partial [Novosphingobium sp.]|nr:VOC family protein [Novosphingobium sp.]
VEAAPARASEPDAPEAAPGIAAPTALPSRGSFKSAHGSMNHIAFTVPADKFEEYFERLKAKGIEVAGISNHDNSPTQNSPTVTDDVYVRSMYFFDPDGICLEFACWNLPPEGFKPKDVAHEPRRADGSKAEGMLLAAAH